jgi:hypothetical protein
MMTTPEADRMRTPEEYDRHEGAGDITHPTDRRQKQRRISVQVSANGRQSRKRQPSCLRFDCGSSENARIVSMRKLPIDASDEDLKEIIRLWVASLAEGKFYQALELISPAVPPGGGSLDHKEVPEWTEQVLEAVISNYGLTEPLEGLDYKYTVAPLDADMRKAFEERLHVDRQHFKVFAETFVGMIHVDLPIVYEDSVRMSDLTARFYLRPVDETHMVLMLLDIHVL